MMKQLRRAISVEYDIGLFAFSAKKVFLVAGGLERSIVQQGPITMVAATVKRQFVGYFPAKKNPLIIDRYAGFPS